MRAIATAVGSDSSASENELSAEEPQNLEENEQQHAREVDAEHEQRDANGPRGLDAWHARYRTTSL